MNGRRLSLLALLAFVLAVGAAGCGGDDGGGEGGGGAQLKAGTGTISVLSCGAAANATPSRRC